MERPRLPWADRQLDEARTTAAWAVACALHGLGSAGEAELDSEREEELLLAAFGRAGRNVVFDSCDLGTFEELGQRIGEFPPARGPFDRAWREPGGDGLFRVRGRARRGRPAPSLGDRPAVRRQRRPGRLPQRLSGRAGAEPVVPRRPRAGAPAEGVPLVIGWTASILDDVATQVAASFYDAVASGQTSVDRALVVARRAAREICDERGDPSWTLPVLYAGRRQTRLFDAGRSEQSARPSLVLKPLPGMTEGYTPHFIGRRRELQRLLPGLRAGELQAVVLTGLGGAGKSTLATRLARKLEADGWTPLALPSSAETPLGAGRVLQLLGDAFLDAKQKDAHAMLRDPALSVTDRLHAAVNALNRGRFVLVLDNFETNLDEGTRRISIPTWPSSTATCSGISSAARG